MNDHSRVYECGCAAGFGSSVIDINLARTAAATIGTRLNYAEFKSVNLRLGCFINLPTELIGPHRTPPASTRRPHGIRGGDATKPRQLISDLEPASDLGKLGPAGPAHRGVSKMKESARYAKIVEWSNEEQCFVGSCPGLLFGGCHGDDEQTVFAELCEIVEETLEMLQRDGRPLPPPTSGKDYANKMLTVV